jgi:hypothetical protein
MSLSRPLKIGLFLLLIGVVPYGSWVIWEQTRIIAPIDIPVSMSPGYIRTPEFKVNLHAVYLIEISAENDKFPKDTLHCLLGYKFLDSDCAETPSVVKASWVLSSGGQMIAQGSSDGPGGGAVMKDTIARVIGTFDSEEGCPYVLNVNILGDGSKLAPGHPHLKVEVFPGSVAALFWLPATAFFLSATIELIAVLLLIFAGIGRWRRGMARSASA